MASEKSLRVERLKKRAKYCCCRYCGSELHVRQIVFHTQAMARIELYCDQCQKIEYGVEKEAYASARAFVEATQFLNQYVRSLSMSVYPTSMADLLGI